MRIPNVLLETKWRLIFGALTAIWAVIMFTALTSDKLAPYPFEHWFNQDVDSPILALELSRPDRNPNDVEDVIQGRPQIPGERSKDQDKKDREQALRAIRVNTKLDLIYIAFYVAYLVFLAVQAGAGRGYSIVIAALGILAGVFDYVEDFFIFQTLDGHYMAIMVPSLTKWTLLALTLIGIGVMLGTSSGRLYSLATDRLLGLAHVIAGLLILGGGLLGWEFGYSSIEAGAKLFGITIVLTLVHFLLEKLQQWFPGRDAVDVCPPNREAASD